MFLTHQGMDHSHCISLLLLLRSCTNPARHDAASLSSAHLLPLHNPPLEPQLHPYRQLYNLLPGLAWQLQAPPLRLRSRPSNATPAEALSLHLHSFPSHQDQSKPISPKSHKSSQIHFVAYKSLASCSDYLII